EPQAEQNLITEGIPATKIKFVGNVMIDSLFSNLERARASDVLKRFGLKSGQYAAVTLHRPSNVDSPERLAGIISALRVISGHLKVVFPV
ncbi:UDP-N-acetylglucosamine 2-epimerase, partial [Escherichia coli]|nr:UDP-N-acetylglucosamine 2-epimerase [Escherichia coli]